MKWQENEHEAKDLKNLIQYETQQCCTALVGYLHILFLNFHDILDGFSQFKIFFGYTFYIVSG